MKLNIFLKLTLIFTLCASSSILFMSNSGCGNGGGSNPSTDSPPSVEGTFESTVHNYECNFGYNPLYLVKQDKGTLLVNVTATGGGYTNPSTYSETMDFISPLISCQSQFCCSDILVPESDPYNTRIWFFEKPEFGCSPDNPTHCYRWKFDEEFGVGVVPDCLNPDHIAGIIVKDDPHFEGPCM